jgi:glyoxylase-like metal-dependent hydrolase (beta-lactamase superfamily II)
MSEEHAIHVIDTAFQRDHFDAAYLLASGGRGAFIDCGTSHALPRLLAAVESAGLGVDAIDWLILTHVHLDHAGGAGALMQRLPNARLLVHPRGAPHMIDPTRLVAGATAVYGEEEMARSYGDIVPVAAERVVVAGDGHRLSLGGRELLCIDTPGHARHHLCVWDAASRSWFTGDTFGLSYRELDSAQGAFVVPTTSPVQFEPDALHASIQRLMAQSPAAMYLTHYGRVQDVPRLAADLHAQIDAMTAIARACDGRADRHRALVAALGELYLERARAHGCRLDDAGVLRVLGMDIELNAQGLECWLDRDRARPA